MPHRRTPPTLPIPRTAASLLSLALFAALATACGPGAPAAEFVGTLLDADGAAVANAVVYVADDGVATTTASIGGADFHTDATGSCQYPTEAFVVRTCTDASGGFRLVLPAPSPSSVRLVFESSYWRRVLLVDLLAGGVIDLAPRLPALEPDDELEAAVRYALPTLADFDLIFWNDEKAIFDLTAHTQRVDANVEPLQLVLPIRQPSGAQEFIPWIAYHHDQRELGVLDCAIDPQTFADVDCEAVPGPSLTFQGMPWLEAQEFRSAFIGETQRDFSDQSLYQLSLIAVVGDELDATYYGQSLEAPHTPSSLQGLRSVLDVHYAPATVDRLLGNASANYLLHNQIDLRFPSGDDAHDDEYAASATPASAATATAPEVGPSNHFLEDGIKFLRPVMIADATVYDAVAGERLVPNYFARVDAMANRQDLFLVWVQLTGTEAPGSLTSLDEFSNAFAVRTRIGGYRRFTVAGQEGFSFPTVRCDAPGTGSLMDAYAERSRDANTLDNEYWMWWTNTDRYPGAWGCAGGFGTLHETPRDGAVSWTSFRNYTLETVGQTFIHEGGHLLDARHPAAATNTRCRILGIFPIGVTGPSIMGGTSDRNLRANCFAPTSTTATSLRNRTRVAEYLHANLE